VGWPELVGTIAKIRDSLPAEQRARLGILAGDYGAAGAIDLYGPAYQLPPAISGINSFWQRGYGAFSVSASQFEPVLQYIETQPEHHHTRTFQEEYRELLRRHGVDFDERYVWDLTLNRAFSAVSYG